MTDSSANPYVRHSRSDWIRLRTFIVLRWIAIFGQIAAITVAVRYYNLQLNLGLCFVVIGASTVANLVAMAVYPENKHLTENQLLLMFLFDISQLSLLLFLTGGLHNPFSLLVLVPVAISASILQARPTIILGLVTITFTTLIGFYYIPLRTGDGTVLIMPDVFIFGFWVAIIIGTVFLGLYERRVTTEIDSMSDALLATQMALSREQKLTDLGGVVAAAAHELGTPLATIKLVSTELIDDLADMPQQKEDVELIRDQTDRCRDILRSMGQIGKDDLHLRYAPLSAVVEEAAAPHMNRGKPVTITVLPDEGTAPGGQPEVRRQPEIIHGLRNLIQNAVDFAGTHVWVDIKWSDSRIAVKIIDDGSGFPPHLIRRIGDPFVHNRRPTGNQHKRPGYEGMGLGLFIAKTLLERSGADLSFANGCDPFLSKSERPERCGAIVQVVWPRTVISRSKSQAKRDVGENQPMQV
jgi:two-component system sensor histidine kinase RegB